MTGSPSSRVFAGPAAFPVVTVLTLVGDWSDGLKDALQILVASLLGLLFFLRAPRR